MKPVLSIATVLAFSLLSSFRPNTTTAAPAGVTYQINETVILPNMEVFFCNGETVVFPELTMRMEGEGVLNNKVNVLSMQTTFTGTGTSTLTGKAYTFNEVFTSHYKTPLVKGAYVQQDKFVTQLTNEEGYTWKATTAYRFTITATGVLASTDVKVTGCQ